MNNNRPPTLFSPLSCLGGFFLMGVLLVVFFMAAQSIIPASLPPQETPAMRIIFAASPTAILAGNTPHPLATVSPTPPSPGQFGVGIFVQISGTGKDGLRLRSGPGTANPPLFLGSENEVFQVRDGPKQADGYTWWLLVAPYDELRTGWAVQDFLSIVAQAPGR